MIVVGLLLTFLGFVISLLSLAVTSSVGGRLVMVLAGIAMSLFGILGLLNKAYLKNAIWKQR
jgi:cytochrome c biogenesis protein CcdA